MKFDDFANGVLIDAKDDYRSFIDAQGNFKPWFTGVYDDVILKARNQLEAAGNYPVQWIVSNTETAAAMQRVLAQNGITGIQFVVQPIR